MKLFEYMAKGVFTQYGIPVPKGKMVTTPEEAGAAAAEIGPAAIKVQILAGGRGKAGGIRFADDPAGAEAEARQMLGMELHGYTVEKLLVEEKLSIDGELYLAVTVDSSAKKPLIMASASGGVNIEEVPEGQIIKRHVDVPWGMRPYIGRDLARRLGLEGGLARQFADIAVKLYKVFESTDAEMAEINPLVISGDRLIAADGRLNIDDEALFRQPDLPRTSEATPLEAKVREIGLSYVELDGDIAVMANGAGITMATIDVLARYGGKAMNFLDAGGGAAVEPMAQAMGVLVSTNPKAILVNIFGGITRCDDVAKAIIHVKKNQGIPVPLVVRLVGTNEEEGVELLRQEGIQAYRSMDEAAARVVELARGGGN
ncbi:MAG TPA: ADP-forming succinate--CoA ligase subunit beta [Sphingobacteriaceae bacterium]|nr:ADP-forming succinate--CoA ligase subunit beta [Sphingobacteriaceae bacterium]